MIKGLATLFVGMFMLLWSAPLAWSVGQQGEGQPSEVAIKFAVKIVEPGTSMSSAECSNMRFTCLLVRCGYFDKINEAVPATIGAATDVPLAR